MVLFTLASAVSEKSKARLVRSDTHMQPSLADNAGMTMHDRVVQANQAKYRNPNDLSDVQELGDQTPELYGTFYNCSDSASQILAPRSPCIDRPGAQRECACRRYSKGPGGVYVTEQKDSDVVEATCCYAEDIPDTTSGSKRCMSSCVANPATLAKCADYTCSDGTHKPDTTKTCWDDDDPTTCTDLECACKAEALCTTMPCPWGHVHKTGADTIKCATDPCTVADDVHTCCDPARALCATFVCPDGRAFKNPLVDADGNPLKCARFMCEPADADTCCQPS